MLDRMRTRAGRRSDERGAVALLVAVLMSFVLVAIGAFAVDIGQQRVGRSDMQALADVVSLDLVRLLDGSNKATVVGRATWNQTLSQSVARNSSTFGSAPVVVAELGSTSTGSFVATVLGTDVPTAVRVTATTTVPFSFGLATSGTASRSAISSISAGACYYVGSYGAAVNTHRSTAINPLFRQLAGQVPQLDRGTNGGIAITAVDYAGLAQSSVNLSVLAAKLGVGSLSQLATSTVSVRSFYLAVLDAMTTPKDQTNVAALNSLVYASRSSSATLNLGQLLTVGSGTGSLAGVTMNALDLVGGSLAALNGTNVASVNLGSTLPGISNANAQVTLIQGPRHYCGVVGTRTSTATSLTDTRQVGATVTSQLNPITTTISVPAVPGVIDAATTTATLPNNVNTAVSVAPTTTQLTGIQCATRSSAVQGVTMNVTNGLATLTLDTNVSNVSFTTNLLGAGLAGSNVMAKVVVNYMPLKVTATVSPSGLVTFAILVPPRAFDTPYPTTATGIGITAVDVGSNPSVGASYAAQVGAVSAGTYIALSSATSQAIAQAVGRAIIAPLLDNTNPNSFVSTVINPILGALGTDVGGADISLDGAVPLACATPQLVG